MQECTIITWIWHDILTAETLYCFIYNYSKFNCFSLNKRLRDTILFVNTAEKKATSHFFSSIQSENYCCCNCSWIFGTSLLFLLFLCYGGKCYIFSPGFGWQRITAEKFITAKKKKIKRTQKPYILWLFLLHWPLLPIALGTKSMLYSLFIQYPWGMSFLTSSLNYTLKIF